MTLTKVKVLTTRVTTKSLIYFRKLDDAFFRTFALTVFPAKVLVVVVVLEVYVP